MNHLLAHFRRFGRVVALRLTPSRQNIPAECSFRPIPRSSSISSLSSRPRFRLTSRVTSNLEFRSCRLIRTFNSPSTHFSCFRWSDRSVFRLQFIFTYHLTTGCRWTTTDANPKKGGSTKNPPPTLAVTQGHVILPGTIVRYTCVCLTFISLFCSDISGLTYLLALLRSETTVPKQIG